MNLGTTFSAIDSKALLKVYAANKPNMQIDRLILGQMKHLEDIELDLFKVIERVASEKKNQFTFDRPLHSIPGLVAQISLDIVQAQKAEAKKEEQAEEEEEIKKDWGPTNDVVPAAPIISTENVDVSDDYQIARQVTVKEI